MSQLSPEGSIQAEVVETSIGEDVHTVEALTETGADWRLADGVDRLSGDVDAIVWACTSGSFVFGWDRARAQAQRLGHHAGAPASSTSLAFVHALRSLGHCRVTVAATYPAALADRFVAFLGDAGVDVLECRPQEIFTAVAAGTVDHAGVAAMVTAADRPDAEAILVPDTALHGVRRVDELESLVGKPVLTANQVTVWEALRLAGVVLQRSGLGRIFAAGV
jgi:maleate cis-trans isomerase